MAKFLVLVTIFLVLIAVYPASAFIERNNVENTAQFSDYIPASYLKQAGVTDDMTVEQALDRYITYALGFSGPQTTYAYISELKNPDKVSILISGGSAEASRGDPVSSGMTVKAESGGMIAVRYPGGVKHTIYGPYSYEVPSYGNWGKSADYGKAAEETQKTAVDAQIPDISSYAVYEAEINCLEYPPVKIGNVLVKKGEVIVVHYSIDPSHKDYFSYTLSAGQTGDIRNNMAIIVKEGASAVFDITEILDLIRLDEKSVLKLKPKYDSCSHKYQEKTLFDTFEEKLLGVRNFFLDLLGIENSDIFELKSPTVTAGVRG